VGIPALALAAWAQPGASPRQSLARRLAHFVVPAAMLSSLLGLVVFYGPLLYWYGKLLQGPSDQIEAGVQNVVVIGQTSLTAFLGLVGLLLVVFARPPTEWWAGGSPNSGDKRPALLALLLAVGFVAAMFVPLSRSFFDLKPLTGLNWALILIAVAVWLLAVRWVWRSSFLERFFIVDEGA
jgi:hypothetical protein